MKSVYFNIEKDTTGKIIELHIYDNELDAFHGSIDSLFDKARNNTLGTTSGASCFCKIDDNIDVQNLNDNEFIELITKYGCYDCTTGQQIY